MRYDLCADHAERPHGAGGLGDAGPARAVPLGPAPPDFRGRPGPAYPAPVNEVATAPVPAPPEVQRWGLGDVLVGWVVVYLASILWGVAVIAATGHVGDDFDELPLGVVALAQLGLALGFFLVPWVVTKVKGNGIVADLGLRARWEDLWKGGLAGIVDPGRADPAPVLAAARGCSTRASTTSKDRPRRSPIAPTARSTSSCSCSSSA